MTRSSMSVRTSKILENAVETSAQVSTIGVLPDLALRLLFALFMGATGLAR
jgi:hypothetical protein